MKRAGLAFALCVSFSSLACGGGSTAAHPPKPPIPDGEKPPVDKPTPEQLEGSYSGDIQIIFSGDNGPAYAYNVQVSIDRNLRLSGYATSRMSSDSGGPMTGNILGIGDNGLDLRARDKIN